MAKDDGKNKDEGFGERTTVLQQDATTLKLDLQKAKGKAPCLVLLRGIPQGQRYFLTQVSTIIGRDSVAMIQLADPNISRKHAQVEKKGDRVFLTDLRSSNGTFVNDRKLAPSETVELQKDDQLKFGNYILKYIPAGELEILLYDKLGSAAQIDPLTGAFNRGYLVDFLNSQVTLAKQGQIELCVLFADIDFFKKINDQYGHDVGDYVLKEFSSIVKKCVRQDRDILGRYGGEEFVIVISGANAEMGKSTAEKIRAAVESHQFQSQNRALKITVSIGVSSYSPKYENPDQLLKAADQAMYSAKSGGRNKVVCSS